MRRTVCWIALAVIGAACAPVTPTPQPVRATATPPPTRTPTVTPTRTATPTRAPSATPTLAATPSPTIPPNIVVERGKLPPGFSLTIYAHVTTPSSLAFGPDGRLYVASTNSAVYALADRDGDRRADEIRVFAQNFNLPLGVAWLSEALYVSSNGKVQAVEDTDGDGAADRITTIVRGLPAAGLHQNDGLAVGPDGYLYLGMGSTCNACRERDTRSGTILRFRPDGSELSMHATGLRNPYDVAFNSAGDLFATDNSRDDLGRDQPPEELNHIRAGMDYGWPDCWAGNTTPACAETAGPAATFLAHSSANGLVFYQGNNFPAEYRDNAFVAVLGSIYLMPERTTDRGVARVRLARNGDTYTGETEWFVEIEDGRPVDVTVGPDGGLYIADYEQGLIYRIVYGEP